MELELLNLLLVLLVAWIGGAIAIRLGYPAILGELISGIIFGPALLQLLVPTEATTVLAEMGIILMMLYIGMEIDFRELKKASWAGLLAAIGGFLVPFIIGYYTILGFGGTEMGALFVAIAVGVTSLITKSRILVDLRLLNTRIAHVLMAGALISDTFALVIFAAIISFADAGNIDLVQITIVAGKAISFFIGTALLGIYMLPFLGKQLEKVKFATRTFYFAMMLIIAIGFSELAELAGLHHILGAFMAGLFLRDSVFNRRLSKELNKVFYDISIGFLAPIFFVTAGYNVTLNIFQTDLQLLIAVVLVATFGKIIGTAIFYLPSGYGWREGITVGAGMNGRGAVEIIIAGIALEMGFITQELFSILVFMAIFTTATVPVFLLWTTKWLRKRGELVLSTTEKKEIIIIGAGYLSLYLAKRINKKNLTLIDSNFDHCERANRLGIRCINGNALKEEVLREANAQEAVTLASLTYNNEINVLAAQLANEVFEIGKVHVLLSPSDEGATVNLLNPINATTLFARKVDLQEWDYKIHNNNFKEIEVCIYREISSRVLFKKILNAEGDILPILYKNNEGEIHLYHYGVVLEPGFKVIYLK
jgi:Kef-type K+ transport system membrane component KefB